MSRVPVELQDPFKEITSKCYADQCKWFLNGFWDEYQNDAEKIWGFAEKFSELDNENKKQGNCLDEFWSHKFLESLGETLTVIQLRDKLRTIDLDGDKHMSIIEYLIFRYNKTCEEIVHAPQGVDKQQLEEAQRKVDESQAALTALLAKLEESKAATAAAKAAEQEAKNREAAAKQAAAEAKDREDAAKAASDAATAASNAADEEARKSEAAAEESQKKAEAAAAAAAPAKAAEEENRVALEELNKQEEAYNNKIKELEKKSQEGGVVTRSKAANELAQLKNEDPLPLRKAKITQAAALKKAEKAAAALKAAEEEAKAAADKAAAAAAAALEAKNAADLAAQQAADAAAADADDADDGGILHSISPASSWAKCAKALVSH